MRTWAKWTGAALAVLIALAVRWYLPDTALPARFALSDCRTLAVTSAGEPVTGAEDLFWDRGRGLLFLSAYDRLEVARAQSAGTPAPTGGLYALARQELDGQGGEARALVIGDDLKGGTRPHGIDVAAEALVFINRTYPADGQTTAIWQLDLATGALSPLAEGGAWCAANDLIHDTDGVIATLDRKRCPGVSWVEMARGRATGRLVRVGPEARVTQSGLRFANGIARLPDGRLMVAETRANRIRLLPGSDTIPTPGGPDNLSISPDGTAVTALHADTLKIGLYLSGHLSRAPSRLALIDPATGQVEILFDDPEGALFAGASTGVMVGDMLVAGSVRDAGLLVCRK